MQGSAPVRWKACPMYWTELTVEAPEVVADAVGGLLFDLGVDALHEMAAPDGRVRLRTHLLWGLDTDDSVARMRRSLRELGRSLGAPFRLRSRKVVHTVPAGVSAGEHGWCFDVAMPVVVPELIGARIVLKAPEHDYDAAPRELLISLLPSRAFGNGTHETTRLCVRALERQVRAATVVLDIGTGTGLLALVAARLGASRVIAFDIEREAVMAARDNAVVNGLEHVVSAEHGDALADRCSALAGSVDLVVANLLPSVVTHIVSLVKRALAAGGRFVVSGLRVREVRDLDLALLAHGFDIVDVTVDGDWCCLVYAVAGTSGLVDSRDVLARLAGHVSG